MKKYGGFANPLGYDMLCSGSARRNLSTAMNQERKTIPQFASLDEEMAFWAKHSLTEFELRDVTPRELDRAAVKKTKVDRFSRKRRK